MKKINRTILTFSLENERRRDALLRTAWLNIVAAFACRPYPRSAWDEAATGDYTPWKRIVTPIRCAVYAAVKTGDKKKIRETTDAAVQFLREIEADFLSLVPAEAEESLVQVALEETEAEGSANVCELALVGSPTDPNAADRAVLPLSRQYAKLGSLLDRCRKLARESRPRLSVVR